MQPRSRSNAGRSPFDHTKSRLAGRERHVVGHYRLGETLEGKRAKLFGGDASLERYIDPLAEQYLAVLSLSTEPSRHIAYRADCGVAGALGKPDLAQRRISLCDPGAKAQFTTPFSPIGD